MLKVLWDFEIQADHLISARRLSGVKLKEGENRDKYLDLVKKSIEPEGDGDTNCDWCTWNNPQRIGKGTWKKTDKWRPSRLHHY